MKLLGSPASPFVAKIRIAAQYLGLVIEDITVKPQENPAELLQNNPLGKIPTLVADDGEIYFDSRVIMHYLDLISEQRLFSNDPYKRLKIEKLEAIADGLSDVLVAHIYERILRPAEIVHQPWLDRQWSKAERTLDYLENNLPALTPLNAGTISIVAALGFAELRFQGQWNANRPKLEAWRQQFLTHYPDLQSKMPA